MNPIYNYLKESIDDNIFNDSVNVTGEDENSSLPGISSRMAIQQYLSSSKNMLNNLQISGNENTWIDMEDKPLQTDYTETTYISDALFKRLEEGNIREVRKIVDALLNINPNGEMINRFKEILNPPVVTNTYPSREQMPLNNDVFRNIDTSLKNQWIVILSGKVVDHSKSYKQLFNKYKESDVIITYFT